MALGVQPIALPHGFLDVFDPPQLSRIHLTDFEAKTIGAQVNGSVKGLGLHEEGGNGKEALDYVTNV